MGTGGGNAYPARVPSAQRLTRTLQSKLLLTFAAMALFTSLLGLCAVSTIERLNESQGTMYMDVFGGTHLIAVWLDRSWEARANLGRFVRTQDPAERERLRAKLQQEDTELRRLFGRMDEADWDRQDVETLAGLESAWNAYAEWRDQVLVDAVERGDSPAAMAAFESEGLRLTNNIDAAIDSFLARKGDVAQALAVRSQESYGATRQIAIALSAASALLALLVGWMISRRIARGVSQVAAAAQGLAVGDIDQQIEVRSSDEVGQMAAAFRDMVVYQQEMARVADAMAKGDLSQEVQPKNSRDVLGTAFQRMTRNLRMLVNQLEDAVRHANRLVEQNARLHERVRRAASRTTSLNEQSLRRISADLHDGPCQGLSFALMRLDALADAEAAQQSEVQAVKRAVQEALAEIRAISTGLRLPELTPLGVEQVAERAVRAHERQSGAQVNLQLGDLPADAPVEIKIVLFRALQEALSNATRHGGSADIAARVWGDHGWLRVRVSDRGPGFDPEHVEAKGRLGLASMRECAELLGGTFAIDSAPGRGACVDLAWPLPAARPEPRPKRAPRPEYQVRTSPRAVVNLVSAAPQPELTPV
jgi:signal transduction histidine kinase